MSTSSRRGFALVELGAAVLVFVLVAVILLPMAHSNRRAARLGEDLSKLRRIGTLTRSYGADFNDTMWALSWKNGNYTTHWPDMQTATPDPLVHGARQVVKIMREKGGGTLATMPVPASWIAHVGYSHLALQDYSEMSLPDPLFISSQDRHRLAWASSATCLSGSCTGCLPSGGFTYRWRFSSSFGFPTSFYDQSAPSYRISQSNFGLNFWMIPNGSQLVLHGFKLSDIKHPSGKVMVHDLFARHHGSYKPVFFVEDARVPLLLSDGSAGVRLSADANKGASPNGWSWSNPMSVSYSGGNCWEPPPRPLGGVAGPGRYRWPRMGIGGRDFGGPEVWP